MIMVRKKKINYEEGTCFFVPLRNGGYARGLVARCDGDGRLFVYFFGPKLSTPTNEFVKISYQSALIAIKCGDLGLLNGEWKLAGSLAGWDRANWPFPPLFRENKIEGWAKLSFYDDHTLDFLYEESVEPEKRSWYPEDSLYGYGAAEILLTKLLERSSGSKDQI